VGNCVDLVVWCHILGGSGDGDHRLGVRVGGGRSDGGKGGGGMFKGFPRYSTTFQTADFTALTAPQASLLAAQSEYSVLQNADVFRDVLR